MTVVGTDLIKVLETVYEGRAEDATPGLAAAVRRGFVRAKDGKFVLSPDGLEIYTFSLKLKLEKEKAP